MNVNTLKGQMAEALVEGILRRAGYQVAMIGRESRTQELLRLERDRFLPDFLVWKTVEGTDSAWPPYRLVGVEVKYRRDVRQFLRHELTSEIAQSFAEWPELYMVLVTDRPDPDRSCFQVLGPEPPSREEPTTMDLHEVPALDIFRRNVFEHENLVRVIFPLLGSVPARRPPLRKPLAGVSASLPRAVSLAR